jgi:hypothetical protein
LIAEKCDGDCEGETLLKDNKAEASGRGWKV